ncbi:MAG: hypothetical protein ACLFQX_04280 [Candidatus Kapaibacterium sp.]
MRLLFILLAVAFISTGQNARAQKISSPLNPVKGPEPEQAGLVVGFGQNYQSGSFLVECEDCLFEGGVGFGWTFGGIYEKQFTEGLRYGAMLMLEGKGIESTFQEHEPVEVNSEATGQPETVNILFRHTGEVSATALTALPFVKWAPSDYFFVKLGPTFSYVMSAGIKHTKELMQETVRLSTGEVYDLSGVDGSNSMVVEDGDFPEVNALQIGLSPMVGLNIPASEDVFLSFVYQHVVPLNNFSEYGEDFKIGSWRILFELRFRLNED